MQFFDRYSSSRQQILLNNYYNNMENLTASALFTFSQARDLFRDKQNTANQIEEQQKFCERLHKKVEVQHFNNIFFMLSCNKVRHF